MSPDKLLDLFLSTPNATKVLAAALLTAFIIRAAKRGPYKTTKETVKAIGFLIASPWHLTCYVRQHIKKASAASQNPEQTPSAEKTPTKIGGGNVTPINLKRFSINYQVEDILKKAESKLAENPADKEGTDD